MIIQIGLESFEYFIHTWYGLSLINHQFAGKGKKNTIILFLHENKNVYSMFVLILGNYLTDLELITKVILENKVRKKKYCHLICNKHVLIYKFRLPVLWTLAR